MAMKIYDLTGKKIGIVTVISLIGRIEKHTVWNCKCDCGQRFEATSQFLTNKRKKLQVNCKCLFRKFRSTECKRIKTKHGKTKTRVYNIWCGILRRVDNDTPASKYYKDRGITICDRWRRFESFYEDMGDPPSNKHSIDRVNNNGNYEPGNCRWATSLEQNNNSSRCNMVTYKGKTQTITMWAKELGIKRTTLSGRIVVKKWPIPEAMEIPVMDDHRCNLKGRKKIGL